MNFKKFRSESGEIRVASSSGHVALITTELANIPEVLWPQAYAAGAISEDMRVDSMVDYIAEKKAELAKEAADKRAELKDKLRTIISDPTPYVDKDNRLIYKKVLGIIGAPIKREELDSAWDEILKEEG